MTPNSPIRPGKLQLKILKLLWGAGPSSVSVVHESLSPGEDLAYTTVATMLRKMERRGLVNHSCEGRKFIYAAAVEEDDVSRSLADDLLERVFAGDLSHMVQHLLSTRDVSADELASLERLIAKRRRQR